MTKDIVRWKPSKELWVVLLSLLWMWFAYYTVTIPFRDKILYRLIVWVFFTAVAVSFCLPAWWVLFHKKEDKSSLGITSNMLLVSLCLSVILAATRIAGLIPYLNHPALMLHLIYNGLSIWEVSFLYAWLFSRFNIMFGNLPAIVLTTLSTGIYHIGTLSIPQILSLCAATLLVCAAYSTTHNILTIYPVYWVIGCTASTMSNEFLFDPLYVLAAVFVLIVQIIFLSFCLKRKGVAKGAMQITSGKRS